MKIPRVYSDAALVCEKEVILRGDRHHYLAHVLRLSTGDPVALFNEAGEFHCRVLAIGRDSSRLHCERKAASLPVSCLQLVLYISLSKSRGMDLAVQKATELGVSVIQPVLAARSVVSIAAGTQKLHRWQGIARSACEQCGRSDIPLIMKPLSLEAVEAPKDAMAIVLDPDCRRSLASELHTVTGSHFHILIGPEGGLVGKEVEGLVRRGFVPASMGARLLRVETAITVALGALHVLHGDFSETDGERCG